MQRRLVVALSIALLSAACARRQPLPASHAEPASEAPPPNPDDPLADHPIRQELRALHGQCDRTIADLEDGVDDEVRRESVLTAVAALAYVVGQLADSTSGAESIGYGPDGTGQCTPNVDGTTHEGRGCGPQPMPSRSLGEGGPIDQQVDEVYLSAGDQIRAINGGLDAIDELVFSSPDPMTWTDEEHQRWQELSTAVAAACGAD